MFLTIVFVPVLKAFTMNCVVCYEVKITSLLPRITTPTLIAKTCSKDIT